MSYLLIIFICLIPFGHFFFRNVDIWHGQGHFVQVGLLILFCYSFFEKPIRTMLTNKPMGSFLGWAGLMTSYWWIHIFGLTQKYPVKIFMPFFNLLCLVLFYKLIIEYLDSKDIAKILKFLKYSFILVLVYCALQFFNLDEFFRYTKDPTAKDYLVGTIGQPSHLGGLLAIISPLFFEKKRESILVLILLWIIIILSGSATGVICAVVVLLFWLFFKRRMAAIIISLFSIAGIVFLFIKNVSFFSASGRLDIWKLAFDIFKNHPILGTGLGSFGALKINITNYGTFQHLHNEYYQIAFELGLVGLVLILWCIQDYFSSFWKLRNNLTIRLASIFFGFCLLSIFNFAGHLWQISVIGMFAYASIYCIKNEEKS